MYIFLIIVNNYEVFLIKNTYLSICENVNEKAENSDVITCNNLCEYFKLPPCEIYLYFFTINGIKILFREIIEYKF